MSTELGKVFGVGKQEAYVEVYEGINGLCIYAPIPKVWLDREGVEELKELLDIALMGPKI